MQIELKKLKAANLFASKEETRYYLNGVLFEIENKQGFLVAIDGHRLIKIPMQEAGHKIKGDDQKFIIPREMLDRIKLVRGVEMCDLLFSSTGAITIEYDGTTYTGQAIDGTFPDYRRVIPDHEGYAEKREAQLKKMAKEGLLKDAVSIFNIGFNPKYLADFAKVNEILGHKGAGVRLEAQDCNSPTIITMGGANRDQYLAVLMPLRV